VLNESQITVVDRTYRRLTSRAALNCHTRYVIPAIPIPTIKVFDFQFEGRTHQPPIGVVFHVHEGFTEIKEKPRVRRSMFWRRRTSSYRLGTRPVWGKDIFHLRPKS
jgi:hypothetical protein